LSCTEQNSEDDTNNFPNIQNGETVVCTFGVNWQCVANTVWNKWAM